MSKGHLLLNNEKLEIKNYKNLEMLNLINEHLSELYDMDIHGHNDYIRRKKENTVQFLFESEFHQGRICDFLSRNVNLNGMKILNVGCGTGGLEIALSKKGGNLFGIDIDSRSVQIAKLRKERYPELKITFLEGNAFNLPSLGYFDLVISIGMLEHIPKPNYEATLKNLIRLVKPGGNLFLMCHPHRSFPYDQHLQLWFINWLPEKLKLFLVKKRRPFFLSRLDQNSPHGRTRNLTNNEIIHILKDDIYSFKRCWPELYSSITSNNVKTDRNLERFQDFLNRKDVISGGIKIIIGVLNTIHMEMVITLLIKKK